MTFCNCFNCARELALSRGVLELVNEPRGFESFIVNFAESRDTIVPFQKSSGAPYLPDCVRIEIPHRIEHGMIVRVQNVFLELGMTRDVNLANAMMRHVVQVLVGIERVVLGRNINVIDVEKDPAIRSLYNFAQEFPFRHFRGMEFRVAADVFNANRNFKEIARLANVLRSDLGAGKSVGHGEQIMRVTSVDAPPAEVIRQPRGVGPLDQALQSFQMLAVKAVGRSEIHGHTMLNHAILFENGIEDFQRTSPVDHEIFRYDLEPIDDRFFRQDVAVMWNAKADADSIIGKVVKLICRHGR